MVIPFNDRRDGDAENLIHFVLSGLTARPTLHASLLTWKHSASRVRMLLAIIKKPSAYPHIYVSLIRIVLLCSRVFRVLWTTRLNSVADKTFRFLTPIIILNRVLIFPSTITLSSAPSSVSFTIRSTFLGIPNLTNDSEIFLVYAIKIFFFKSMKRRWKAISCA